ncbi:MAG: L-serine ammonia-lyase, iron-sulfur-dependent subunit beta [Vampirovibrionales bacterium]
MDGGSLFDILGPVMIGPSSSHTAGAVRLSMLAKNVAGQPIKAVVFKLDNSFAKTYQGHGTDRGLVAGLLGLNVDDDRVPEAFERARQQGLVFSFEPQPNQPSYPPNTVLFDMTLEDGEQLQVLGHSLGGGKVYISRINEYKVSLQGEYPTLVMFYHDEPGMIWQTTRIIAEAGINIASLVCARKHKGEEAFMAICLDHLLDPESVQAIAQIGNVYAVRNVDKIV